MLLTFFRRMVGHRLGTSRASVEHARPCACHVLSPDVTRGARRSGQGRSFAGASGFLPDVSGGGPAFCGPSSRDPQGSGSPRGASSSLPARQLPAPSCPLPRPRRPLPDQHRHRSPRARRACVGPRCRVGQQRALLSVEPSARRGGRRLCGAVSARTGCEDRTSKSKPRVRREPCGVVSVPGPVHPPRPHRLHAGEAGRGPRPRLQGARAPVGGRYAL